MQCGRNRIPAIGVTMALLCAGSAQGGSVESSYRAAREILQESITETGAGTWLESGGAVLVQSRGTWNLGVERQGYLPDEPTPVSLEETWVFDPLHGKLAREVRYQSPDGTPVWERQVFIGDQQRVVMDLVRKTAVLYKDSRLVGLRSGVLRRWMPTLLAEVQDNPAALRATGRYGPFDGIQAVTQDSQSLSLFFGRESRQLGWVEFLADLPTWADSTVSWKFTDYRPVEGLGDIPHAWSILVNERVLADMTVHQVSTDAKVVQKFLKVPKDLEPASRSGRNAWVELVEPGVWRVTTANGDHHVLAIEFEDSLLLVDAPAPRPALYALPSRSPTGRREGSDSQDILEALAQAVPDKKVSAVVLTHFHAEHAGGLRTLAEAGARIYALGNEAAAVEEFLDREHTLCAVTGAELDPEVIAVNGHLRLEDASQAVMLMDVGPNPHTAGLLAIWLPRTGLLYLADLMTAREGWPDRHQGRLNRFVQRWVNEAGIEPETVLTAHGDGRLAAPGEALGLHRDEELASHAR